MAKKGSVLPKLQNEAVGVIVMLRKKTDMNIAFCLVMCVKFLVTLMWSVWSLSPSLVSAQTRTPARVMSICSFLRKQATLSLT